MKTWIAAALLVALGAALSVSWVRADRLRKENEELKRDMLGMMRISDAWRDLARRNEELLHREEANYAAVTNSFWGLRDNFKRLAELYGRLLAARAAQDAPDSSGR